MRHNGKAMRQRACAQGWFLWPVCGILNNPEHDPEKWGPVSRLREALDYGSSYGVALRRAKPGRKKIMLQE